jgi:phage tail-like protein
MTHPADKVYRFQTLEHWGRGLAEELLFGKIPDEALVTPQTLVARGLAAVMGGEEIQLLAVDPCGRLLWLLSGGAVMAASDTGAVQLALLPHAAAHGARRLLWGQRTAWIVNEGSIIRLDTLSGDRTGEFDAPGWRVVDAVADRCDGVIVVEQVVGGRVRLRRIRPEGRARVLRQHDGFTEVIAAVRWGDHGPIHVVDLVENGFRVVTFASDGGLESSHDYAGQLPLGPITMDGPGRLIMAAQDGGIFTVAFGLIEPWRKIETEGRCLFGELLDLLWANGSLYAATRRRLYELEEVSARAPARTATYFSPALRSPLGDRSGWLRADLIADLPQGAQVTISSRTFDSDLAARAYDGALRNEPQDSVVREDWNDAHASVHFGDGSTRPLRHYLGDETAEYLALRLEVSVPPCSGPVRLKCLDVLYPNRSLIEAMPAIYRGDKGSGRQLRRMLAPFQALADEIDDLIGDSVRRVDPHQTEDLWTPFLLSWLGHSEFTGLPADQRQALLTKLPEIMPLRGTLAGLAKVLEILAPGGFSIEDRGTQPDFWVLPKSVDPAGARLGQETLLVHPQPGGWVLGGCLPLGTAALRCDCLNPDSFAHCSGSVTVRIFGGNDLREQLEPFTETIARSFVPANTRMDFVFGDHRPAQRLERGVGTDPDHQETAFIELDDESSRALGAWRLPREGPWAPEHSPVLNTVVLDGNLILK